jgi:hypothetical protein
MWDYGPISGSETQIAYSGLELIDGEKYYTRLRVCDGAVWSDWTNLDIRMNSVPAPATELLPANMQGVTDTHPELSHANADDAEWDPLIHRYELYDDAAMTVLIAEADSQPASYGSSSWTVDVELSDDEDYYWRVRGSDPYEIGEWSELASFWVNSVNQLPDPFDLVTPEDSAQLSELAPTFTWTASGDADPYDQTRYTLYYSTDSTFATATSISDLDTTAYTVPDPFEYGLVYYWRVKAYDLFSGETMSEHTFVFTTLTLGDANGDGTVNIGDAVYIISYVFKGGPAPEPLEAGDANCDLDVNIGDAVFIISYVFKGGPPPGCDR